MSEIDPDKLSEHGWFDSESELPGISSVDPAIEPGDGGSKYELPLCQLTARS